MIRSRMYARALAAVFTVCAAGAAVPGLAAKMHNVAILAVNGSGETGTASFSPNGPTEAIVFVSMTHAPAAAQSAGIVHGPCPATGDRVIWGLNPIAGGSSQTSVKADLHTVLNGSYSIVVRASTAKDAPIIACGVIPLLPLKPGR